MLGHARENVIENNIFINASHSQIYYFAMIENAQDNRFVRNIVYYDDPDSLLIRVGKQLDKKVFAEHDFNLFFNTTGSPPAIDLPGTPKEESLDAWRKTGYDTHSVVSDPLFVDSRSGDYRLKPDSPAVQLGFKPIPTECIGLASDD